jgi:hypothetical protein
LDPFWARSMKSSFAWRYANACEGEFQFRLRQDRRTTKRVKAAHQIKVILKPVRIQQRLPLRALRTRGNASFNPGEN